MWIVFRGLCSQWFLENPFRCAQSLGRSSVLAPLGWILNAMVALPTGSSSAPWCVNVLTATITNPKWDTFIPLGKRARLRNTTPNLLKSCIKFCYVILLMIVCFLSLSSYMGSKIDSFCYCITSSQGCRNCHGSCSLTGIGARECQEEIISQVSSKHIVNTGYSGDKSMPKTDVKNTLMSPNWMTSWIFSEPTEMRRDSV